MRQLKINQSITTRSDLSLDRYLADINHLPLISADEEVLLTQTMKQGGRMGAKARNQLITANLRFVVSVAKQYQNQGVPLPDLINEGNIGLMTAVEKFDDTRGFKFISYAIWWIRQSILNAICEQGCMIRKPLNQIGLQNRIRHQVNDFVQKHQRCPSEDELSELLEINCKKIRQAQQSESVVRPPLTLSSMAMSQTTSIVSPTSAMPSAWRALPARWVSANLMTNYFRITWRFGNNFLSLLSKPETTNINTNNNMYKGLYLFKTAFVNTRRQIFVSGIFLVIITFVLTVILYLAESRVDPDFSFWDAFIWPYEKYLGDPGKMVDEPLISPIAKIVGTLVGIMGVAIFAVPAGLIGSGLTDAMDEEKREQELTGFRRRMQKAFRRQSNKSLREYLNTMPDGGGDQFKTLNVVPQRVPIAKMQVRQGMDLKDIMDTCRQFPEFRLKNMADAQSNDDIRQDRLVVEHFPLNTKYGCFVSRQSKVTIVCTSSFDEVGIGWFTYYLAKFGGFNYISKEIEVDTDELDSFYNLTPEPLYDKKPISTYDKKKDKEAYDTLERKLENRNEFKDHLFQSVQDGSWVIIFTEHLKNSVNQVDFHLAESLKDGSQSTIINQHQYAQFCDAFASMAKSDFGFETAINSSRYPLLKKNLGYTIREKYPDCNVFVLRPSSELMNFDDRKLIIAYRMAQLISELLDDGKGINDDDIKDLKETGFGYKEKKEDNDKNK